MKTSKLTRLIAFFLAALCCVGTIVITGSASSPAPLLSAAPEEEEEANASSLVRMMEYLQAIPYSEYENLTRQELCELVRSRIQSEMNRVLSERENATA